MSQTIKFHLDENVSNAIADGLKRRGIDVTTTPELGLKGKDDLKQIEFALNNDRVIFTHDDDLLVFHNKGIKHAGIVYCHQNSYSIGEIIKYLILIWEFYDSKEMYNTLEFVQRLS
ncbi:MAG: DUF5615 family PIN-like protein [Prochloraceae cyanobacterium]|nr:DUF5615 family PIN-like protein [Prochloraceae cyanobacterium]